MIDKERRREERNYLGSQGDFFFFTELSLQCFSQAFSSCSEWGTLSSCGVWASYCRGFSPCRAQALRVQTQKLWCIGWLSSRHVGSSCTRDQTCVPCIGRQIPNHWTTREVQTPLLLTHLSASGPRCSLGWSAWLSTFAITSVSLQQLCAARKHLVVLWCWAGNPSSSQQVKMSTVLVQGCCAWVLSHFSRVRLCNSMVYSLLGSSVHGILQARILQWVAISSSTGSSLPRDWTSVPCVFCIAGRFLIAEPPGKPG